MTPWLRKLGLTAHVGFSVGWLGAVVAFLGLAVAGVASDDAELVRSAYVAMDATARFVLVPLALASLVSGIVQGLGTKWGVFRHYWVIAKLVINLFATVVLLMYLGTLGGLRDVAAAGGDLEALRTPSPLLHAAAALVLLVVATVLAVFKPRGTTRFGRRAR